MPISSTVRKSLLAVAANAWWVIALFAAYRSLSRQYSTAYAGVVFVTWTAILLTYLAVRLARYFSETGSRVHSGPVDDLLALLCCAGFVVTGFVVFAVGGAVERVAGLTAALFFGTGAVVFSGKLIAGLPSRRPAASRDLRRFGMRLGAGHPAPAAGLRSGRGNAPR